MRLYHLQIFPKQNFLLLLKNKQNNLLSQTQVLRKNLNGIFFLVINFATLCFTLTIVFDQLVVTKNNHVI